MLEKIGFFVVAAGMLFAGLRVVSSRNLVHTVLWLGVTLASTAVIFVMLEAPFLAGIQIILYTGGILTLMLFGVMLTRRDPSATAVPNEDRERIGGVVLGLATFTMFGMALFQTPKLPNAPRAAVDTQKIGEAFLTEHVLAFEVLSILLLAAVIGAIVLARKNDPVKQGEVDGPRVPARRRLEPGARGG